MRRINELMIRSFVIIYRVEELRIGHFRKNLILLLSVRAKVILRRALRVFSRNRQCLSV